MAVLVDEVVHDRLLRHTEDAKEGWANRGNSGALLISVPMTVSPNIERSGNDHVCATVEKAKRGASEKIFIPSGTKSYAI
jgi:hypothetical protein